MTEKLKPLEEWLERWGSELPSAAIVDWDRAVKRIPRSRPGSLTREEAFEIALPVVNDFADEVFDESVKVSALRRAFGLEEESK